MHTPEATNASGVHRDTHATGENARKRVLLKGVEDARVRHPTKRPRPERTWEISELSPPIVPGRNDGGHRHATLCASSSGPTRLS